jgi:hypothetical protein
MVQDAIYYKPRRVHGSPYMAALNLTWFRAPLVIYHVGFVAAVHLAWYTAPLVMHYVGCMAGLNST